MTRITRREIRERRGGQAIRHRYKETESMKINKCKVIGMERKEGRRGGYLLKTKNEKGRDQGRK